VCPRRTHAMPAIGVCLLAGVLHGCASQLTPPQTRLAPADSTVLGARANLPITSMWPGETRPIPLPALRSKTGLIFQLLGAGKLTFSVDEITGVFSPAVGGALSVDTRVRSQCIVHVDSLAVPGDTLSFTYIVSSAAQPTRQSRWRMRIVVAARPPIVPPPVEPIQFVTALPNPFAPGTTVRYTVAAPSFVSIVVYDVRGQPVATLVNREQSAGEYTIAWDGRNERGQPAGSGVYFARCSTAAGARSVKMTLVK
jgi:hypothetical protein